MKPRETAAIGAPSNPPPARQPYQKPQLQVYGDLAALTTSVTGTMSFDGSGHPNKHFTS